MPRYSHMYTLAFEVESDHPEGADVTDVMMHQAIFERSAELCRNGEFKEAVGGPDDSAEI